MGEEGTGQRCAWKMILLFKVMRWRLNQCVCVCVCVRVRKKYFRQRGAGTGNSPLCLFCCWISASWFIFMWRGLMHNLLDTGEKYTVNGSKNPLICLNEFGDRYVGEHWICARHSAQLFTCIFHYIFTATICFIIISLLWWGIEASWNWVVALVVELVRSGVRIWTRSLWDSGTRVLSPFWPAFDKFHSLIHCLHEFVMAKFQSINYLVFFFKVVIALRKT